MGEGSDIEPPKLLKSISYDAGRHFFDAPAAMSLDDCILRLSTLEGLNIVSLTPSELGHWFSFQLEEHAFSANDPFGEVWFFAEDPETPEPILQKIALCVVTPPNPS
ncbi:MAG: hypothetical protein ABJL57_13805 [Hyphomonas sp.]|uniref:hypothetical protein n=1 Tax=Alphaproteobacteria TaxID=28211 RepID=UPI003262DAE2